MYPDQELTKNFRLHEFAVSADYPDLAAEIDFNDIEVERIRFACAVFLQPLRDVFGGINISSGKRTSQLNAAVGGEPDSDHLYHGDSGAVDIFSHRFPARTLAVWLADNVPYFKQLIWYPPDNFVHISFPDSTGVYGATLQKRNGIYSYIDLLALED